LRSSDPVWYAQINHTRRLSWSVRPSLLVKGRLKVALARPPETSLDVSVATGVLLA